MTQSWKFTGESKHNINKLQYTMHLNGKKKKNPSEKIYSALNI